MQVCLLCMYVYIFIYTYVDLLVTMFLFYQIIGSFFKLIQNINANAILQSVSLCVYVQNIPAKKREFPRYTFP